MQSPTVTSEADAQLANAAQVSGVMAPPSGRLSPERGCPSGDDNEQFLATLV